METWDPHLIEKDGAHWRNIKFTRIKNYEKTGSIISNQRSNLLHLRHFIDIWICLSLGVALCRHFRASFCKSTYFSLLGKKRSHRNKCNYIFAVYPIFTFSWSNRVAHKRNVFSIYPVLLILYYRLARREERLLHQEFGECVFNI